MKMVWKIISRVLLIAAGVYALLFAVFFFDLDGKFIFKKIEPLLIKHYDKMERRDPLKVAYGTDKPPVDYGTR